MKKIVVTSLVALSIATVTGVVIGMDINHPVHILTKQASVTQPATNDTSTPLQLASPPTAGTSQPATPTTTAPTTTTTTQTTTPTTYTTTSPEGVSVTSQSPQTSITVTAYEQIPVDSYGSMDCKLTYSDGTTYQWHWTVVNPQGTWVTDSQGNNGHWEPSTQTTNTCDSSLIGTPKTN